jgi:predicted amidohydrolase
VLAKASGGEGYITAELDLGEQEKVREKFPSLANRRPEVYA